MLRPRKPRRGANVRDSSSLMSRGAFTRKVRHHIPARSQWQTPADYIKAFCELNHLTE